MDMLVVLLLAGLTLVYAFDWYRASDHILNTILVLPLTLVILTCCSIQFFLSATNPANEDSDEPVAGQLKGMALFALYIVSLNWLGFDVGTFLFLLASLWFGGERRAVWLAGYALAFSSAASLFFMTMLPYPMPMLILDLAPW